MKFSFKYSKKVAFALALTVASSFGYMGCDVENIIDPNNPSTGSFTINPSEADVEVVAQGLSALTRNLLDQYLDGVGVIGREHYRFSTSEGRYSSELLGKGSATLSNNAFYTGNPFLARYRAVKTANTLIEGATNSKLFTSEERRKAILGFAKTIKAYQLLMVLNQQWENGIRVDVADPDNVGPVLNTQASLDAILAIFNEGYTDLQGAGTANLPFRNTAFSFTAGTGFAGSTTVSAANFGKVNRALTARVQAYRKDWNGVLTALNASFYDANGTMATGIYHTYLSAADALNPMFYALNQTGDLRLVHPSFVSGAEAGDKRLSKATQRTAPFTKDGLTGSHDLTVYGTNTTPGVLIRNEELILLNAEANANLGGANLAAAVTSLNKVRTAANLPNYVSAVQADIITQMLKERFYSLLGEGHRWVDMRRYNRLGQLPIDRTGDDVWTSFPVPQTESL